MVQGGEPLSSGRWTPANGWRRGLSAEWFRVGERRYFICGWRARSRIGRDERSTLHDTGWCNSISGHGNWLPNRGATFGPGAVSSAAHGRPRSDASRAHDRRRIVREAAAHSLCHIDEEGLAAVTAAARHFGATAIRNDYPAARVTTLRLPAPYRLTHGKRNPIAEWLDGLGLWVMFREDRRRPSVAAMPGRMPAAVKSARSSQVFVVHSNSVHPREGGATWSG